MSTASAKKFLLMSLFFIFILGLIVELTLKTTMALTIPTLLVLLAIIVAMFVHQHNPKGGVRK